MQIEFTIPFKFPCPPQCVCQNTELKEWKHICGKQLFLTPKGFIFCKVCDGHHLQFIRDYSFQCPKAKEKNLSYKFKSLRDFLMKLCVAIQEVGEENIDQEKFFRNLTLAIRNSWDS